MNKQPLPKCEDLHASFSAVKGEGYSCPKCKTTHNDTVEKYDVDDESYPKCFNESKGYTMDGSYWDWDEIHCCEECGTKYWFRNGAY